MIDTDYSSLELRLLAEAQQFSDTALGAQLAAGIPEEAVLKLKREWLGHFPLVADFCKYSVTGRMHKKL